MIFKENISKTLEKVVTRNPKLTNKLVSFLLHILNRNKHISDTTKSNLVETLLDPQDIANHYEQHRHFYSALRNYKEMMQMHEKDNQSFSEESYQDWKAKSEALNNVRLYEDRILLPNGYVILKQPLMVKDYYRENDIKGKNVPSPETDPILGGKIRETYTDAHIPTIAEYKHMMSFFPGTELAKRELLLRIFLSNKYDEVGLRDCTSSNIGKSEIYGHTLSIRDGVKARNIDHIYDYLLVVAPK